MDLDLALLYDKPVAIMDTNIWERLNRLNLMFMRITIAENIKPMTPKTDSAKEFMESMQSMSQSDTVDKSVVGTLMGMLTIMKFNGSHTMYGHVIEMINIAATLEYMKLKVNESFLVIFIMNSLPSHYSPFQINYNTIKEK
ncbi:hypothetical protein RJ641_007598 [Dillenia turbinata]|uniref:Uncharacterized protein n=1 Tax=Dillenia turbinata TaxID=194707 RepID=A0AAN8V6K3_9MAGN